MNSKSFKPGDVLIASHRELTKGYHPILYLSGHSDTNFVGAMLTHHEDPTRNVQMNSAYFVKTIGFENTFLVIGKFMKPEEWGPFKMINRLTPEGLDFVNGKIHDQTLETFANYFRRKLK
jgi:hypothetical protein